jgi:hypothetical protein
LNATSLIVGTLGTEFCKSSRPMFYGQVWCFREVIKWAGYPEQATIRELFTSIFRSTEARTSRSIVYLKADLIYWQLSVGALSKFIRHQYSLKTGGPGIIPEVEPFPPGPVAAEEIKSMEHFKEIYGATKNWEEARRIAMVTEREVAFGRRRNRYCWRHCSLRRHGCNYQCLWERRIYQVSTRIIFQSCTLIAW